MQIQEVKFILWAKDMDRALAFWRDGIGLKERMSSPHWSELTHGTAIVALHGGGGVLVDQEAGRGVTAEQRQQAGCDPRPGKPVGHLVGDLLADPGRRLEHVEQHVAHLQLVLGRNRA